MIKLTKDENEYQDYFSVLRGNVTILPDTFGKVGLTIPGLLRIDNVPTSNGGTNCNILIEKNDADILRIKENSINGKIDGYEMYGHSTTPLLKGIIKIEKDTNNHVGLEIPGLLSINNLEEPVTGSTVVPTKGNLCLMDSTADYLQVDPEDIILTFVKEATMDGITGRLYQDSEKYYYAVVNDEGQQLVMFIGSWNESTSDAGTITSIPTWTKNVTFSCLNEFSHLPLYGVVASFSAPYTQEITLPKSIQSLGLNNFSGVCDVHECSSTMLFYLEHYFENCTGGTILLSSEQWSHAFNASLIDNNFFISGKIKVRRYTTPEKPITYLKKLDTSAHPELNLRVYSDEQDLKYGYGVGETTRPELIYIGDLDEKISPIPVSNIPNWSSNMIFQCSDEENTRNLDTIYYLNFSSVITSTIIPPKTTLLLTTVLDNISGTLDIHLCTSLDLTNFTSQGALNKITNCTNGTLLVNETQWTALSSLITGETGSETLDGKIKIQKYQEGEQ